MDSNEEKSALGKRNKSILKDPLIQREALELKNQKLEVKQPQKPFWRRATVWHALFPNFFTLLIFTATLSSGCFDNGQKKLQEDMAKLQDSIRVLEHMRDSTQTKLDSLLTRVADLTASLAETCTANNSLREKNSKLARKIRKKESSMDSLVSAVVWHQARVDSMEKKLDSLISANSQSASSETTYIHDESESQAIIKYFKNLKKEWIVISETQWNLATPTSYVTLSGTVSDANTNQSIPEALVIIIPDRSGKNNTFTDTTDQKGGYSCRIPENVNHGRAVIQINRKGYKSTKHNVWTGSDRTNLDYSLPRE